MNPVSKKESAPGAVGSFADHLKTVRTIRRVPTTLGEKNALGDRHVDLPAWFARTGLISFEIDSGFGTVKCRMPDQKETKRIEALDEAIEAAGDDTEKRRLAVNARDDGRQTTILRLMREIPADWPNERETVTLCGRSIEEGSPLPQPTEVSKSPPAEHALYLTLLPSLLPGQVLAGMVLMANNPPIAYEAQRGTSPS